MIDAEKRAVIVQITAFIEMIITLLYALMLMVITISQVAIFDLYFNAIYVVAGIVLSLGFLSIIYRVSQLFNEKEVQVRNYTKLGTLLFDYNFAVLAFGLNLYLFQMADLFRQGIALNYFHSNSSDDMIAVPLSIDFSNKGEDIIQLAMVGIIYGIILFTFVIFRTFVKLSANSSNPLEPSVAKIMKEKSNPLFEKLRPLIEPIINIYKDELVGKGVEALKPIRDKIVNQTKEKANETIPSNPITTRLIDKAIPELVDKMLEKMLEKGADALQDRVFDLLAGNQHPNSKADSANIPPKVIQKPEIYEQPYDGRGAGHLVAVKKFPSSELLNLIDIDTLYTEASVKLQIRGHILASQAVSSEILGQILRIPTEDALRVLLLICGEELLHGTQDGNLFVFREDKQQVEEILIRRLFTNAA